MEPCFARRPPFKAGPDVLCRDDPIFIITVYGSVRRGRGWELRRVQGNADCRCIQKGVWGGVGALQGQHANPSRRPFRKPAKDAARLIPVGGGGRGDTMQRCSWTRLPVAVFRKSAQYQLQYNKKKNKNGK